MEYNSYKLISVIKNLNENNSLEKTFKTNLKQKLFAEYFAYFKISVGRHKWNVWTLNKKYFMHHWTLDIGAQN